MLFLISIVIVIVVSQVAVVTCNSEFASCVQSIRVAYPSSSLGARPNSSGAKSRELGLGLETLAAFPCALAECGQSQ